MRVLSLLLVVLVAACGPEAVSTTTVGTTTSTSTTTTVAPTTPSTAPATTTTVSAIEGVPEEALALIGAEMPEVPDFSDGFDAEVWFESYAAWNRWAFANPEEGLVTLDQWVVPGSDQAESLAEQLRRWVDEGWVTVRSGSLLLVGTDTDEEFIDEGLVVLDAVTAVDGTVWIIDSNEGVVAEETFLAEDQRRSTIVLQEGEENWLLDSWH